jgi:hypothetical protein
MAIIPNSGVAGTYSIVGNVTTFLPNPKVECAYRPSVQNVNVMPYFEKFTDKCGKDAALITKPFLNGMMSQIYSVIDGAGITLNTNWLCDKPDALWQAINLSLEGELSGVING